jgi:ribosomal protein S18 acetylase RimI-like enzyme
VAQGFALIRHRVGAPALRLGLGPGLRPVGAIGQLGRLLESNSFWARGRSHAQLRQMLKGSDVVVSALRDSELVGFSRATSDGVYRAVLWDVVVASPHAGRGLGRMLVQALLEAPCVAAAERVYLMTTESRGFYERLGFSASESQQLMMRKRSG